MAKVKISKEKFNNVRAWDNDSEISTGKILMALGLNIGGQI